MRGQERSAPSSGAASHGGVGGGTSSGSNDNNKWVNVNWMPHTSLAQSSHVCFIMRSAHVTLDDVSNNDTIRLAFNNNHTTATTTTTTASVPRRLRVRITIHGVAGPQLVPVACHTPTVSLSPRYSTSVKKEEEDTTAHNDEFRSSLHAGAGGEEEKVGGNGGASTDRMTMTSDPPPKVTRASHDCTWNTFVQLPIRWRDLPRDAYLYFEVLGVHDTVVSTNTRPRQKWPRHCPHFRTQLLFI
jgi:hypothetical protein